VSLYLLDATGAATLVANRAASQLGYFRKSNEPLEPIHSTRWDPMSVKSTGPARLLEGVLC